MGACFLDFNPAPAANVPPPLLPSFYQCFSISYITYKLYLQPCGADYWQLSWRSALFQHVNNRQQLEGNNGEFLSLGLESFYSTQRRNSVPLIKILLHLPFPAPQSAPVKLMLHLSLHSLLLPAASTVTGVTSRCNNSAV